MEANIKGEYPIKASTIIMFLVMVGMILGVCIDIIFYSSSDEVQTVQSVETFSDTLEVPTLIEF